MTVAEKRKQIIEAAILLIAKQGYDTVMLRDIAYEAKLSERELMEVFPTKDSVVDAIYTYISTALPHYAPTEEELAEQLQNGSPKDVLEHFVTEYELTDDLWRRRIYRFMFMEQYRNQVAREVAYNHITRPPMENAKKTVDFLVAQKAVPPCDSATLTQMWNRTSLMYEMMAAHEHALFSYDQYYAMTQFFIEIAVRGVEVIPLHRIDTVWNMKKPFHYIDIEQDSFRQLVMFQALNLFVTHGYANVSMSMIAESLHLPLNAIYDAYHSKPDIMKFIVDILSEAHTAYINDPVFQADYELNTPERLVLTLADCYSTAKDGLSLKLYRILFREQYYNEELKDILVGSILNDVSRVKAQLDAMAEAGRISPCDSQRIATAFVFSMCFLTIESTLAPHRIGDIHQIKTNIIAMLVSIIVNGYQN